MKQSVQLQQLSSQPCTASVSKFAVRLYKTDILQGLAAFDLYSKPICVLGSN